MINQVNQTNAVNVNVNVNNQNNGANGGSTIVETNIVNVNVSDILELSGQQGNTQTAATSNNRYSADIARMREIWQDHDRHVESFRRLVEGLLNQQTTQTGLAGIDWSTFRNPDLEVDEATRTAAQEAIGEGGAFSVEAVATRLLDFAVAISGGDPSRIDVLRNAVERGFQAAERQWGGELPEISQNTREAVMEGFAQWEEAGNANAISLLNPPTSVTA